MGGLLTRIIEGNRPLIRLEKTDNGLDSNSDRSSPEEEDCGSARWEDPAGVRGLGKPLGRHLSDRIWLGPKVSNPEVPKDFLIIWKSSSLYDRLSQGELGVILIPSINLRSTHQRVVKPSLPICSPDRVHIWTQWVWQVSQGRAKSFSFHGTVTNKRCWNEWIFLNEASAKG